MQLILGDYQQNSGALREVSGASVWTGPVILSGDTAIGVAGTQQIQNGIAIIRVGSRRAGGVHALDIFFAGEKARQHFLVIHTLSAVFAPQVLDGIARMGPLGDFPGALAI